MRSVLRKSLAAFGMILALVVTILVACLLFAGVLFTVILAGRVHALLAVVLVLLEVFGAIFVGYYISEQPWFRRFDEWLGGSE